MILFLCRIVQICVNSFDLINDLNSPTFSGPGETSCVCVCVCHHPKITWHHTIVSAPSYNPIFTHRPGLRSTMRWPYSNEVIVFFDRNWTFPRRTLSWIVICKPCAMMNILPRCCKEKLHFELFF